MDNTDQELEQKRFIETRYYLQQLLDSYNDNNELLKQLPDNISKVLPEPIEPKEVVIPDDFKIANVNELAKAIDVESLLKQADNINQSLIELISKQTSNVTVDNIKDAKTDIDLTPLKKELQSINQGLKELSNKDNTVIVKAPETKLKLPSTPKEAIPVVLVDSTKKRYYDANSGGSGAVVPSGIVTLNSIVPYKFDSVYLSNYNSNNDPQTVVYKYAGATVATLTITYSGTNITSVVRT